MSGGVNVHNDSLQFLAEQGIVGYGLILLCVLLLVVPLYWQAVKLCRMKPPVTSTGGAPAFPPPGRLQRFPIVLFTVSVGAGATVCHSLGDLPFRDPAVLVVWMLAWSCVAGWMPAIKKS